MAVVAFGDRSLLALRALLELGADVVGTSENAFRGLWDAGMALCGYTSGASVPRADATATVKHGMEGDGLTAHVRDGSGAVVVERVTVRFSGSKQVGLVLVVRYGDGSVVVVGVGHYKSGVKSVEEEKLRASQVSEHAELLKKKASEHSAVFAVLLADFNAAPYVLEPSPGVAVAPLAFEAAAACGFVPVYAKECDGLVPGSTEWLDVSWTSNKERDVTLRGGSEAKRHRKIEIKTAANDWAFYWLPAGSSVLRIESLLPPAGGPCKSTRMAAPYSDHLPLLAVFTVSVEGRPAPLRVSVGFGNLLARFLDDEMLGELPPTIACEHEAVAVASVRECPRKRYSYDVGEASEVLAAPYGLDASQGTYKQLATAMDDAWIRAVRREATERDVSYAGAEAALERPRTVRIFTK